VREALFMALEPLSSLRVLDLYAGSGALGIEALSRGAERVDFVESDAGARRVLGENLDALDLSAIATIWPLSLPQCLRRLQRVVEAAQLILVDPPYGGEAARATLDTLGSMALRTDARIVVEHHSRDLLPESNGRLERTRERQYGETRVTTYHIVAAASRPDHEETIP
jgi:16S rRNA (guanine966-N2)-methyltransferase